MQRIPLFPLHTVLFPGGPLQLRIFEPRYVDMVGRCMREDTGFGVALIVEGSEAGGAAQHGRDRHARAHRRLRAAERRAARHHRARRAPLPHRCSSGRKAMG